MNEYKITYKDNEVGENKIVIVEGHDELEAWLVNAMPDIQSQKIVLLMLEMVLLNTRDVAREAGCSRPMVAKMKSLGLIESVYSGNGGDMWEYEVIGVIKNRMDGRK